jgi:hypothetical protein
VWDDVSWIRTQETQEARLRFFCELLASPERALCGLDAHGFFVRLLFKIPPNTLAWLFGKRFSFRPFIGNIDPKRIFPGVLPLPGT